MALTKPLMDFFLAAGWAAPGLSDAILDAKACLSRPFRGLSYGV